MSIDDDIWSQAPGLSFENEAAVETRLIVPLLRALGYNETDHIVPKYPVMFQEGRKGRRPEADFVVFAERPHSRATSLVTVEAKHPNEELSGGKEQGESYAANIRTPLLMITNGRCIQIWQYQPTYESELVLDCSVIELPAQRGKIEAILAREAILAYARTMRHKSLGLLARDLGAYERAEFERGDGAGIAISRRLKNMGSGSCEVASTNLLTNYPDGAALLAASGYGKTTLACELRRQALEKRWSGESSRLPVEVFLPDLVSHRESLEIFLCTRVAAHCPQVSLSAFRDCLREDGIVLLADGFDRVPVEHQPVIESALVTFRRDFPNTQLFLFTRAISCPKRLALPSVELLELNGDEQHDLVERCVLTEGYTGASFWYCAPSILRKLCRHPLILQLTLVLYKEQGQLPRQIEPLFQAWLDRLLPKSLPLARRTELKRLLTSFANATVNGPLSEDAAVELVRSEGFSDDLLQSLLDADALTQRGTTVELQHEALADYLRALDVVKHTLADVTLRLKKLPLLEGSQLPALLMAFAKSAEMQRLVWREVISADITAAMGALRYRADLSPDSNAADPAGLSRDCLSEILQGIELPLQVHFPRLASRIQFDLVGSDTQRLGIIGTIEPKSGHLSYSFVACGQGEDQVKVGQAVNANSSYGMHLTAMGLRLDSGRLIGMSHIRDGLLKLVKERRLDGGIVWAEERTLGRLRHLVHNYDFPYVSGMSLEQARDLLIPSTGSRVMLGALRAGQTFEIDDLVAEIEFLITEGRTHLDPWWGTVDAFDLDNPEGRTRLGELLDMYYRRTQLAYREVVETSFPLLASRFPLYQVMPVRYEIEIESHHRRGYPSETLHWRWMPVATFDQAGATVVFPSEVSDMRSEAALGAYRQRIDEELARLGRCVPNLHYTLGQKAIPNFDNGFSIFGAQVDETVVVHATSAHIEEDLKFLFRELPTSDQEALGLAGIGSDVLF
ncbi:type I restriction enzyme HsdR N-terminal domain-containing protein [Komagataeibacter europaeus]|uniref:type I restriction enzyme HsdR N-terminal domain-containing protein n=1 Tax=Komagataeibacter europaeus TaxID=33995 RepID=UPI000237DB50|nr:type I restriction enzyme HsdR N-terminal domain-containing protein [Komagataeibacter europaeus]